MAKESGGFFIPCKDYTKAFSLSHPHAVDSGVKESLRRKEGPYIASHAIIHKANDKACRVPLEILRFLA